MTDEEEVKIVEGAEEGEQTTDETRAEKNKADQELAKTVMTCAAQLVRASNGLPKTGGDYELLRSFGGFAQLVEEQQKRVTSLISRVLSSAGSRARLSRERDFEHFFDRVVEANDGIVERAGIVLDEMERSRRNVKLVVPQAVIDAESTRRSMAGDDDLHSSADLTGFKIPIGTDKTTMKAQLEQSRLAKISSLTVKPQKTYGLSSYIDTTSSPFVPRLILKHHAIERSSKNQLVVNEEGTSAEGRPEWTSDEATEEHPYAYELDHWEPPEEQLKSKEIKKWKELDETPLSIIDTKEGLEELVGKLNRSNEFSVDLEAHSHRSFAGLVCLMQLSTRDEDFIVDPFPIWEHMHLLNEPFADPKILKVFHGSDSDVLWLQRDFGIYTQNIFDTYRAMKREGTFGKFSLAALVSHYCGVQLQKEYQLADWRVRPLPEEMINYARGDSHYLLYCYDRLRERLLEGGNEHANLLRAVYTDGVELSKKVYEKPVFDVDGYRALIGTKKNFNNRQLYALAELWKWRDITAREEDESTQYVLPNHMMLTIAEALPREMQGILACCSPIPLLVKQHLLPLHRIIFAARDRPLEKTVTLANRSQLGEGMEGGLFESMVNEANRMTKMKALLRSPLDFSHSAYNEEIGAILRDNGDGDKKEEGIEEKKIDETFLSVIGVVSEKPNEKKKEKKKVEETIVELSEKVAAISSSLEEWATPFERYTIALQETERKNEEKRLAEEKRRKELGMVDKEGKRLYSHHDPVVCRKPVFKEGLGGDIELKNKGDEGEDSEEEEGVLGQKKTKKEGKWDEEEILTKKKMKQLEKKRRAAADIHTEGPSQKKGRIEKAKVEEEEEEGEVKEEDEGDNEAPVDYSQYDAKAMFEQPQSYANARSYNPLREMEEGRMRGGKRGRRRGGGHMRARGMSHSFKPHRK